MEVIAKYLIYLHAICGGVSLLSGTMAILFKKGGNQHKRSGKVFYLSLLMAALLAIIITLIPSNFSPFLLAIGIFSLYLLLSGYRALRFKFLPFSLKIDKMISTGMLIVSILMILLPLIMQGKLNIVLAVFGGIGLFSSLRDLRLFRNSQKLKENWMTLHLGNMMGAYIASFTAFLVVNDVFPPLVGWLGPTVVGSFYIAYWNIKLGKKRKKKLA